MFRRTEYGDSNRDLFFGEVIVWIEGSDDFPFYHPLLEEWGCRMEPAGGKERCRQLAADMIERDLPYVVVMDGDYGILEAPENAHARLVTLRKYSIENYLFDRLIVQTVCSKYAGTEAHRDELGTIFDELEGQLEKQLMELVILDVTNWRLSLGLDFFPSHAGRIFALPKLRCDPVQIEGICAGVRHLMDAAAIAAAREHVVSFVDGARFTDLIRGHFLFDVLRQLIVEGCKVSGAGKPTIDNRALLLLLAAELWHLTPTSQHQELAGDLRAGVENASQLKVRPAFGP